ncbi:MAG: hypothetical protein ACRCYY_10020 [Trueperaceae bacterium]
MPQVALSQVTLSKEFLNVLAAPFHKVDLTWRVVNVVAESREAILRPQLRFEAVLERLNNVLGVAGWSCRYQGLAEAVSCELVIAGVSKSAVAESTHVNKSTAAQDALVYAAELFGLVPPVSREESYTVDYDLETQSILFEPEVFSVKESHEPTPTADTAMKSAGQQAIDKLVERLETQGRGKDVAKLIVQYGGYGQNSEAARELYSKLRALLVESGGSSL